MKRNKSHQAALALVRAKEQKYAASALLPWLCEAIVAMPKFVLRIMDWGKMFDFQPPSTC